MKVGYLQFQPKFGNPEKNISHIQNELSDREFDLLVLPELANSGYLFSNRNELEDLSEKIPDGKFCRSIQEICSKNKGYIVSGVCEKSKGQFYNSSILVCPDEKIFVYRKLHLFDEEKKWFTPGNKNLKVYKIGDKKSGTVKIGMMICFDWVFPETARTLALKGAGIICHPSNLVMSYCQTAMQTRALENHVFTITANRIGQDIKPDRTISFTGESVILSPKGKYLHRGTIDKEECIIVDIDPFEADNKNLNLNNNLFKDRRDKFYQIQN